MTPRPGRVLHPDVFTAPPLTGFAEAYARSLTVRAADGGQPTAGDLSRY